MWSSERSSLWHQQVVSSLHHVGRDARVVEQGLGIRVQGQVRGEKQQDLSRALHRDLGLWEPLGASGSEFLSVPLPCHFAMSQCPRDSKRFQEAKAANSSFHFVPHELSLQLS